MERRHFLTLALGLAVGTAVLTASAQAAPLMPQGFVQAEGASRAGQDSGRDIRPAVSSRDEVDRIKPEQVRWGHGHHYGWHHRHWGWHHRHHWGWRHRHWHRHWHHRHW
jgi:hypothetical protein